MSGGGGGVTWSLAFTLTPSSPLLRPARFTWHPDRPWEVAADFNGTAWLLSWELLVAGLDRTAGSGDVIVRPLGPAPGGARHELEFHTPKGHATLQIRTAALRGFVRDVQAVWKPVDIDDAQLAAWIAEATP